MNSTERDQHLQVCPKCKDSVLLEVDYVCLKFKTLHVTNLDAEQTGISGGDRWNFSNKVAVFKNFIF